jgi:hypothetical protein
LPAVTVTEQILERGYAAGVFRRPVDAVDLHMMISAFCFFRVANRHTFGAASCPRRLVTPYGHDHVRYVPVSIAVPRDKRLAAEG